MEIVTQLAVFLENRPGTLARVCDSLGAEGINIHALTTSDTVDHTVLRLIVSDPRRALFLFEEHQVLVVESDVLMLDANNKPGSLAEVARCLGKAKVNIEYLYCATSPKSRRGLIILRVSNPKKALAALRKQAEDSGG